MINGAAGVAVRLGGFTRTEQLYPTANSRHRRATAQRMGVFKQHSIVRIVCTGAGDLLQGTQRIAPLIRVGQCRITGAFEPRPDRKSVV